MDVKEKWELETNLIITNKKWRDTFTEGHTLKNSPSWREFEWKVNTPITSKYTAFP